METAFSALQSVYGNCRFLLLYAACLVAGLILLKGQRKQFLIPGLVISVAILNPLFYQAWAKLNESMVYWRTLWMLPVLPVCAAAAASAVQKAKRTWIRYAAVIAGVAAVVLCGSFVYTRVYLPSAFRKAHNADKLPDYVVSVAEDLLELDDEPYVVSDTSVSPYLRQYSGRIHLSYGRNALLGDPGEPGKELYAYLTAGDYGNLARAMAGYGYRYLVTSIGSEEKEAALYGSGFVLLEYTDGYGIFRVEKADTE
ncbi:MAG: hypothetical protein K6F61_08815 [Clostridiales bacterium]|nr:hypothetical protein [Clostridiales bacterium]